ncbi:MAG: cation:proton antiporter [Candidatus Bathyarchaeia archaeon]
MDPSLLIFSMIAAIMALSFIGDALSRKILLPSVLMLMILGIVFGPLLNLFPRDLLMGAIPYVAPLTLAFVSFEAGLSTDMPTVLQQSKRAIPLAVLGFVFSMFAVGTLLHYVLGIRWAFSLLMASAWSGVNITVVSTIFKYIKVKNETHSAFTLVSLLDDPIVLISTLTILNYILLGQTNAQDIAIALSSNIAISLLLGVGLGLLWLNLLYFFRKEKYTYTFTLAALFVVYVLTEILGGTGVIAVFVFALFIGNYKSVIDALKLKLPTDDLARLKKLIGDFHTELAFMVRSFFFTFVGIIYIFTGFTELLIALACVALLHVTRYISVKVMTFRSPMATDIPVIGWIIGKGAAAAAMSTLPLVYNLPFPATLTSIALSVILFGNITSIVLPFIGARFSKRPAVTEGGRQTELTENTFTA